MNDLGWALAGLAARVAVLLAPALAVQAWASRRGPGLGGSVAAWSLALVVALDVAAFAPRPDLARKGGASPATPAAVAPAAPAGPAAKPAVGGRGFGLAGWPAGWERLGERASGPARRARPWGWVVAAAGLAGVGLGVSRLGFGLVAVGLWRRRAVRVEDPELLATVEELRHAMGCRRPVDVRAVAGLGTPATAGWRRPVVLLPTGWPAWGEVERRAAVAHELAHVCRGDYAAGLLARAVVALNAFHPLAGWMTRRLLLEQELAADALAAPFAGGRPAYLAALASLALRQDGTPPGWPARAFLPARGALIRRIAMLKDETAPTPAGPARRLALAAGLLALAAVAATLQAPALADDAPGLPVSTTITFVEAVPFDPIYVADSTTGFLAVHPAAAAIFVGRDRLVPWIHESFVAECDRMAREINLDTTRPGFLRVEFDQIESLVMAFTLVRDRRPEPIRPEERDHRIRNSGMTIRMVAPFDWLALFRQWRLQVEEVGSDRGRYYRFSAGPLPNAEAFYGFLPNDRTVVVSDEPRPIEELIGRAAPAIPAYLRGTDWERTRRGLVAFVLNNRDDSFAREYDLGRADDAMVLPLFRGVDRWVVGLDAGARPALHAEATARSPEAAAAAAAAIEGLVKLGLAAAEAMPAPPGTKARAERQIVLGLLGDLRARPEGATVVASTAGFGSFANLLRLIQIGDAKPPAKAP